VISRHQKSDSVRPSTGPGSVDYWLRRVFIEDWSLKLLALAITLILWFAVTGQRTIVKRQLRDVQLTFRTPQDMEISDNPRGEVDITLSGTSTDLDQVNARELMPVVDVTDRKPGERVIQLVPGRLQMDLPRGVHLDDLEPNSVLVKLEPRIERELVVEPRIEGKLPPPYEVKEVTATPSKIRVRGPASHVNALQKAPTEAISVEGRRDSFDAPQTAIYISDPKVDVLDITNVHVEIGASGSSKPKSRVTN